MGVFVFISIAKYKNYCKNYCKNFNIEFNITILVTDCIENLIGYSRVYLITDTRENDIEG